MKCLVFVLGLFVSQAAFGMIVPDDQIIQYATSRNFFDPRLALAIARVESSQNSLSRNADHYGMMQIKLGTARMLGYTGKLKGLFDWRQNLDIALQYLSEKYEEYASVPQVVAAYNAGKVYICRTGMSNGTPCARGRFVNQKYVDDVMRVYRTLSEQVFTSIPDQRLWLALQDST